MCIGTNSVGERGQRGHVPRTFKSICVWGGGVVWWCSNPPKICISFTNIDVIYYCLQALVWRKQIIINSIYALPHVLIDCSVKSRLTVLQRVRMIFGVFSVVPNVNTERVKGILWHTGHKINMRSPSSPSTTSGDRGLDKAVASDSRTPACTVTFCTWQSWM